MSVNLHMRKKALLQEPINGKVRCQTCERRCLLIEGGVGWCRTRVNEEGRLYTLTYGSVSSLSANPIEKKPFYHFHPGTHALTAGSWSCNFGCPWCQNWNISKRVLPEEGHFMSARKFVEEVQHRKCQGTSISFNEPTLSLEWSLEVFRLAGDRNLYNTYVTNGYMTTEALNLLADAGLNAMNVDIKGSVPTVRKHCKGINVERVWERCIQASDLGIHLEITTLVIPGVNDGEGTLSLIAERIHDELNPDIPWHVSGYRPAYRFRSPSTPISTLEHAWEIGQKAGLNYVYIGNVPGHPLDNTHCPVCDQLLIRRLGFEITEYLIFDGRCSKCGFRVAGVGL